LERFTKTAIIKRKMGFNSSNPLPENKNLGVGENPGGCTIVKWPTLLASDQRNIEGYSTLHRC